MAEKEHHDSHSFQMSLFSFYFNPFYLGAINYGLWAKLGLLPVFLGPMS